MNYKYQKKPVAVEAFQMTSERRQDQLDWPKWLHKAWDIAYGATGSLQPQKFETFDPIEIPILQIVTLEGVMDVGWGDYIIRGIQGELYPCKPDIFEASYEKLEEVEANESKTWKKKSPH